MGRLLALCGWLAWQVRRPLRRLGSAVPVALAILLLILAAVPIVIPQLDPQPQDVTVQEVIDGAVTEPSGWVRLRGRISPLEDAPTDARGDYALLVDEVDPLRAIVVRSDSPLEATASAAVTGHVEQAAVVVEEDLPIEATVAGTPPQIVSDRLVALDAVAKPERVVPWPLAIPPVLLAVVLLIGARAGYPIFRPTTEIDVLAGPLGPGERLPAAYGGRVGPNVRDLADPGGALLLVRRGPKGNLLTAQPLADDGGVAPQPVTIGGSWTSGRLGYVHTVTETVPALVIRSELVDATFLFARTAERDRVAALVAVER
jgi:hypothetical protein